MRYDGLPVWIGQASMPLGGRFGKSGDEETPASIDPKLDEVRNDIVQDLIYSQFVKRIGFVKGAVLSQPPDPGPDTDGLRAVLFFDMEPVSLDQVQFLDWESLSSEPETP